MTNLFSVSLSPGESPDLVGVGERGKERGDGGWRGRGEGEREVGQSNSVMFTLFTLIIT